MTALAAPALQRTIFETSRADEYFNARELQAQTGQPAERFGAVALKELIDNALNASETAGVAPALAVEVAERGDLLHLTVADNGAGIAPETVARVLNFATRTSDKAVYRAPTRGAQGNALKTILGLPWALGLCAPVVIESRGVRHTVLAWLDPAGALRVEHGVVPTPTPHGTRVRVALPAAGQALDARHWARAFALFNPHAAIKTLTATRPKPTIFTSRRPPSRTAGASGCRAIPPRRGGTTRRHCGACSSPTSARPGRAAGTSRCASSCASSAA